MQWWFKKFFRDKRLEDEEHSGRLSEVDSGHLRGSSKLIILQLHEKWPKNSTLTILQSFGIWSKLERWKIWIKWCLMNWMQIKKAIFLKCHFLFYATTTTTKSQLDCDLWWKMDFIWQPTMTSSVVKLRRSSKALLKVRLALKKGHGHCLVVCCQSDPLQLSENWWNHYIWEVYSAYWRDALKTAGIAEMQLQVALVKKGPNSSPWQCLTTHRRTHCFKSWANWTMKFCLIHHVYLTSCHPPNYHFFKHLNNFLQGKLFHK